MHTASPGNDQPDVLSVELRIPNRIEGLGQVKAALENMSSSARVPPDVAQDMLVALDEVLSNIVHYAYAEPGNHEIRVLLQASPGRMDARISDDGQPFDPLAAPPPRLDAPAEEWPVGGLGIHLVRRLMSEVSYQRTAHHNRLHLVRCFDPT